MFYRHKDGKVFLEPLAPKDGKGGRIRFNADSSWKLVPTPCAAPKKAFAFESVNYPDVFLMQGDGQQLQLGVLKDILGLDLASQ